MEEAKPSRTALGVAIRRASHQLNDATPLVLEDAVAVAMLGRGYRAALDAAAASLDDRFSRGMRAWVVARSRYAEDKLAEAVRCGVRQYVLLGAGLDTFAHRNPHPGLRVFEADHPATQAWKRELVTASGLAEPADLHYVAVDFERQSLARALKESGLDFTAPTVFAWLGVVLYLTPEAFRGTVELIASFPKGSGVVMDYAQPRSALGPEELAGRDLLAARVLEIGEPFQLFLTPEEMARELAAFRVVEDLDSTEIHARYFADRVDGLGMSGRSGRLVSAWR